MSCHDTRTIRAAGESRVPNTTPEAAAPPVHEARSLTGGAQTACIMLDGKAYTLRITRAGKLILTK
jgi:hemin uptake protein HemP